MTGIGNSEDEHSARQRMIERQRHVTAVCEASRTGTGPLTPERLAEIRHSDQQLFGQGLGFNGYSMAAVDRHDLLRHLDALAETKVE
jgi:hypothetical protein